MLHFNLRSSGHRFQLHFDTKAAARTLDHMNSLRELEQKYGGQGLREQSSLMTRVHY